MSLLKKIVSVSLTMIFVLSVLTLKGTTAFAAKCEDGPILHAWNWYFKDVTEHMAEIAEAGYKSVQVSPVQKEKKVENGLPKLSNWWALYQPVNFKIGNILGTREEFKEMCDTAHKYGVNIIVDVVSNHLANESDEKKYEVSSQVEESLRKKEFWHCIEEDANEYTRFDKTQKSIGMPDLNTGNEELQNIIISFLNDCQECGADGFRFDAAKHIELPKHIDGDFGSDYWPNIIKGIKTKDKDAFIYGETLNPTEHEAWGYAQFMHITADKHSQNVRNALTKGNAGWAWGYESSVSPDNLVTWVESHDTYVTNKGYGESAELTDTQIRLGWSLIGGRDGVTPLFFVRPNCSSYSDGEIGGPGNKLWKDPTVVAVNKFHNECLEKNKNEYVMQPSENVFGVERGDDAAILTNISPNNAEIYIETNLKEGYYWDELSGNYFYVKWGWGGKKYLTGIIKPESVAILRKA